MAGGDDPVAGAVVVVSYSVVEAAAVVGEVVVAVVDVAERVIDAAFDVDLDAANDIDEEITWSS